VLPSDADQTVKFNSSNRHVATVDQNGVVTAKKEGTAVIRVRTPNGKKMTCKITVKKQNMSWIQKMFMKLLHK
ncbi:MAG: Ig-like domain-containing protein, partial [Clostridia bacterium]|nr:Ig-like domain-containing protein [Clostridia bacterium]